MVNWEKVAITTGLGAGGGLALAVARVQGPNYYGTTGGNFTPGVPTENLGTYLGFYTLCGALLGATIGVAGSK